MNINLRGISYGNFPSNVNISPTVITLNTISKKNYQGQFPVNIPQFNMTWANNIAAGSNSNSSFTQIISNNPNVNSLNQVGLQTDATLFTTLTNSVTRINIISDVNQLGGSSGDTNSDWIAGNGFIQLVGNFSNVDSVKFGNIPAQWFNIINNSVLFTSEFPVSSAQNVNINLNGQPFSNFTFKQKTISGTYTTSYAITDSEPDSEPFGICVGPDNNLWVADEIGYVWKVTTSGTLTSYAVTGFDPQSICAGPDGNLWVVDNNGFVSKIATNGIFVSYELPGSELEGGICVGSDGNLWVADNNDYSGNGKIWKITTSGIITSYILPGFSGLIGICAGPDGNLWVPCQNNGAVLKITTSGNIIASYLLSSSYITGGICAGPDGNLWVTDGNGFVWKITIGGITAKYTLSESYPLSICAGPDGNLWVTDGTFDNSRIWQVTTSGVVTPYSIGPNGTFLVSICTGPDGNLWVADENGYVWKVS